MQTFILGYLIGCALGVFLGALIGSSRRSIEIWNPIVNFIRSVPSVAKIPVIMALLGIGMSSRICSVAVAVLFPVLMSTMRAIASTDEQHIEISRILGLSRSQSLFSVRIPSATGEILTGLHAAVQVALLIMVVSEMLGASSGLGAFIVHSQSTFMISDMWVGAFILGVIGLILNEAFHLAERRIAPWYFKSKEIR
jgi:ABC-type nitrate/sulfonate/bicarbonate transport system permease component